MIIVGCDFHPAWQQIAVLGSETREIAREEFVPNYFFPPSAANLHFESLPRSA